MDRTFARTVACVAGAAFAVHLGIYYWPAIEGFLGLILASLAPIALGFVLAYPLGILMGFFERHLRRLTDAPLAARLRPGVSLLLAVGSLAAIVTGVVVLVVPQLLDCVRLLMRELPAASSALVSWLEGSGALTPDAMDRLTEALGSLDWKGGIGSFAQSFMSGLAGAVAGFASGAATFALSFVFALFVLLNRVRLASQANAVAERYLSPRLLERLRYVLSVADDCFHRFLVGQCTEAVILGALCAAGMLLLGLPHPWMISALTAFMALIPIVGALLSGVVGTFLILMESPAQALAFLVFIVVLQQLEGDLIYPHVVGSSIQLPGIWVLAAVTVGGGAFGIIGMFVGVPLAAVAYRLIRADVARGAAPAPRASEELGSCGGAARPVESAPTGAEEPGR